MIRVLMVLVLALATAPLARAHAEIGAIPGWTRVNDETTILFNSPADANGYQVAYLVHQVTPVAGDAEAWFREMVSGALAGSGEIFGNSGLQYDQDIINQVLHLRRDDGVELYSYFAAYPTRGGYQLLVLFYPLALSEQDPRVSQALDHIAAAWRTKFQLTSANGQLRAAASAPQASEPAAEDPVAESSDAAVGAGCRREAVWGFRFSPWCQPSGICNDRVIKGYETVCD